MRNALNTRGINVPAPGAPSTGPNNNKIAKFGAAMRQFMDADAEEEQDVDTDVNAPNALAANMANTQSGD